KLLRASVDCDGGARRLCSLRQRGPRPRGNSREGAMRAIALAMIAASIAGGVPRASAAELIPFSVGEASPANTFLAIWVAQAAGFYEANGLKLEIVHMVGGRDSGPSLKSGRIHLMHIGMSSVVRANLAGGELRSIGSLSNVIRATMFAAPQIKTNAELKGGTFGISSEGAESDSATPLVPQRLGPHPPARPPHGTRN